MARIRNIKPDFWTDEKLVELEPWERLLFIGLWSFVDDEGYMPYSPKRITMQVFPGDSLEVSRGLQNLISMGALTLYDSVGGQILHVTNWEKHQKVSNPTKSKYPLQGLRPVGRKPRKHADSDPEITEDSVRATEFSRKLPKEREREREREGKVVVTLSDAEAPDHDDDFELIEEGTPNDEPETTTGYPADFNTFWDTYPRRGGKGAACTAFLKAKKRDTVEAIIAGAERMKNDPNLPDDGSLIALPATWLNQDRWADDPLPARTAPKSANRATDRMRAGYNDMAGYQGPTDDPWTRKEIGA